MNIEVFDRYSATGTPYPVKGKSCDTCEGMGIYPEQVETLNTEAVKAKGGRLLIVGQHDGTPERKAEDDGYVFVECPECCGSREKEPAKEIEYGGYKWIRGASTEPKG